MGKFFGYIKSSTATSVAIWMMFMAGMPFCLTFAFGYPFMLPLVIGLLILLVLLMVRNTKVKLKADLPILVLFALLFAFWGLQMIFRLDTSYASNLFQVFCVFIIYMAIVNLMPIERLVKQYATLLSVSCIGGTIIAILLLIKSFPPLFTFTHHNGENIGSFYYLTFTNWALEMGNYTIIRYSGLFDEAGTLAFFSMLCLLMNKILLKNKKVEILLIILPLFNYSLAHFVTITVYFLLFYVKKLSSVVLLVLLIGSLYFALDATKDTEYNRLYKMTIGRFQEDEEKGFAGNNRSDLNETALEHFKESPVFGKGKTYYADKELSIGGISYTGALYGVFGYVFVYIFLIYAIIISVFKNGRFTFWLDGLKCCLIVVINLFQRWGMTNVFQVGSLMLFMLCIYYVSQANKDKRIIFSWNGDKKRATTI